MRSNFIYIIGLVITIFLAFYFYQKYRVAPSIELNNLSLTDLQGNKVELKSFQGKKVVCCFGASWCVNCREELDVLLSIPTNELAEFEIIVISDESIEKIQRFKDKRNYPFTFLKLQVPFSSLGINSIPTTYLINKEFKLVKETVWYMNWEDPSTLEHYRKLMD